MWRATLSKLANSSVVVSEFAVVRRIEGRMTLCELAPEVTLEQLLEHTEMELALANPIVPMLGV